jgi:putative restriction endonuclease
MRISEELTIGEVYTRKELQEQFNIQDATIRNGVFPIRSKQCIWLFVTADKTEHSTDYFDELRGDDLFMDGQNAGRTDQALINHEANGVDVLLFYRGHPREYEGGGFTYEGTFRYVSHRRTRPAHFHFQRVR